MSAEKVSEPIADVDCILKIGKNNNVVAWRENMQTDHQALWYGANNCYFRFCVSQNNEIKEKRN
jgi:hypothetical protein